MQNQPVSNRLAARCTQLAALALIVAALYETININNLVVGIGTGDISKHYGHSVLMDGSFASLLLLLTAVWLLFLSPELKKGMGRARAQAILIGIAFCGFGAGFWYKYPSSLRLPAILFIGLMILVPALIFWKSSSKQTALPSAAPAADMHRG